MKNINKKTLNSKKSDFNESDLIFTPENIIENIDKVGAWSSYGLASIALSKLFPKEYNDETGKCPDIYRELKLIEHLGCNTWHDVIIKFQTEIGYDAPNGFNPNFVNER